MDPPIDAQFEAVGHGLGIEPPPEPSVPLKSAQEPGNVKPIEDTDDTENSEEEDETVADQVELLLIKNPRLLATVAELGNYNYVPVSS